MNGRRQLAITGIVLLVLLGVCAGQAARAQAAITRCQPIVKKIYSTYEGPPFYKANVLVTYGDVPCSEARRLIWKALTPGGFSAHLNGWRCEAKGPYDPFIEKCQQEDPRRVIKSSKPKLCRECHANSKREQLLSISKSSSRYKTLATVSVFDEPSGDFTLIGGLVHSDHLACQRGRSERYYRLAGGAEQFLGTATTNKAGVGTLQLSGIKHGTYIVKVKKKQLNDGSVCLPARARGGLAGARRSMSQSFTRTSGANAWQKCGTFKFSGNSNIVMETKHYACFPALEVIALMLSNKEVVDCITGCEINSFHCSSPGRGKGFLCVKENKRIRIRGETKQGE